MRLMCKTWRFVGNWHAHTHTHATRSLAGPRPSKQRAPRPREKVAVAGPPFVVIIMALRCRCPSPLRIERGHLDRPASNQGNPPAKRTHATPPTRLTIAKSRAAYAPEMIIRRWWRGLAHPSHTDQPPPVYAGSLVGLCHSIAGPCQ